jgi:hypothetical protein
VLWRPCLLSSSTSSSFVLLARHAAPVRIFNEAYQSAVQSFG